MLARSTLIFYINQRRFEIGGRWAFRPLTTFLRGEQGLGGTKIVCAEGDCGACTVLIGNGHTAYKSVNACILPLYLVDGHHIITVEGLSQGENLHPAQQAIVEHFGTQCGYCTPGIVQSMAVLAEHSLAEISPVTLEGAKSELVGNLCRCTGYQPILDAAMGINLKEYRGLRSQYTDSSRDQELAKLATTALCIEVDDLRLDVPISLSDVLELKAQNPKAKVVAGASDLGVLLNKKRLVDRHFISLQKLDLKFIRKKDSWIEIGANATLTEVQRFAEKEFPELARALDVFASSQIRNCATLIGNLVNASPIGDTIPLLLIAKAELMIYHRQQYRTVALCDFYLDYKKIDLKEDEIVTSVRFPVINPHAIYKFYKVSMRKDLDISIVNFAAMIELDQDRICDARLAFGGVAPTVLRIAELEQKWKGARFERSLFEEAGRRLAQIINPISDLRGSREYRLKLCRNLLLKLFDEISGS